MIQEAEAKYEQGKSQAQQTYDKAKGKIETGLTEVEVRWTSLAVLCVSLLTWSPHNPPFLVTTQPYSLLRYPIFGPTR